jgi:hypothetical protein
VVSGPGYDVSVLRSPRRTGVVLLAVGFLAVACPTAERVPAPFPPAAATRDGRWRQDVDYLAAELPRLHVDAYVTTPRATFEAEALALSDAVPDLPDHVLVFRLCALTADLRDDHTRVQWSNEDLSLGRLPLGLQWFDDGLHMVAGRPQDMELLGWRLLAVNDVTAAEAAARVAVLTARENEASTRDKVPGLLVVADALDAVGLLPDPAAVRYTFECVPMDPPAQADAPAPARRVLELAPVRPAPGERFVLTTLVAPPPSERPRGGAYWFERLPDGETLLLGYESCRADPERPFADFVASLLAEADAAPVARLVIDVRRNSGGDSGVAQPLLDALEDRPDLAGAGRLYVLIGHRTYSSAMLNAWELRERLGAVLVGESTGGRPNAYGELRSFRLPNSGLQVTYSTKRFVLLPGPGETLAPDILAPLTSRDWLAGRDVALAAALAASERP